MVYSSLSMISLWVEVVKPWLRGNLTITESESGCKNLAHRKSLGWLPKKQCRGNNITFVIGHRITTIEPEYSKIDAVCRQNWLPLKMYQLSYRLVWHGAVPIKVFPSLVNDLDIFKQWIEKIYRGNGIMSMTNNWKWLRENHWSPKRFLITTMIKTLLWKLTEASRA